MEKLITILDQEHLTCLVCQNDIVYKERANGIQPILRFYQEGKLNQAIVIDKVIGKAAAMILVLGGIQKLHAHLISEHALNFLKQHSCIVTYDATTPYIMNRKQDGMCPMEETVLACDDMKEAYSLVIEKVQYLKSINKK